MLRSDRRQGRGTCSVIVSILLFAGIAAGLFCWFGAGRVPNRVILEVDFDQGMTEYVPDDPLARILLTKKPVLRDVVEALQKASNDKRVKGPVARVGDPKMKLALV